MARRDFGNIRKRPNGRWQARYQDDTGRVHSDVFATRGDAARFLASVRADMDRGAWFDPLAGVERFDTYAERWVTRRRIKGRPLGPRTQELYRWLLSKHTVPTLGRLELRHLTVPVIRDWHASLTGPGGPGEITAAKCYRLVRAICNTAVAEELIPRNPCAIPGAGQEASPERPVITVPEVYALADAVGPRWRAAVLLASFCGLRFGELAALTRDRLDLLHATVTVAASASELAGGRRHVGPPKSEAGRRLIAIPVAIVDDLTSHVAAYSEPGPNGLVFVGENGGRLRNANFGRSVWRPAVRSVGLAGLHFHDLRHTGNTLAAATGASTKELMARMGHSSMDAALRYQHATRDRDAAIAAALSALVAEVRPAPQPPPAIPIKRARSARRPAAR